METDLNHLYALKLHLLCLEQAPVNTSSGIEAGEDAQKELELSVSVHSTARSQACPSDASHSQHMELVPAGPSYTCTSQDVVEAELPLLQAQIQLSFA